ncbi:YHS domain-containing (seleno)protein [Roseibium sediminicola]|uniref:YHS domain-containing protein n=1 Tax=Roseibium sediminicola TaxID=2933272 RepID=A0ABT0H032_9HYPH|nr:hypothetical protein [Roseibium sp. CAU 1639]
MAATAAALAGERINAEPGGVAVKGYDVVAYFTPGEPTPGKAEFEYVWRDVRWRFSNKANQEAFAANPTKYAPRYGGFCAGGLALGRTSPVDPEAFVIVDGKLYLNFNKQDAKVMSADPEAVITKADENWKRLGQAD